MFWCLKILALFFIILFSGLLGFVTPFNIPRVELDSLVLVLEELFYFFSLTGGEESIISYIITSVINDLDKTISDLYIILELGLLLLGVSGPTYDCFFADFLIRLYFGITVCTMCYLWDKEYHKDENAEWLARIRKPTEQELKDWEARAGKWEFNDWEDYSFFIDILLVVALYVFEAWIPK